MHPLAIAGFLAALALAHATVAGYSLYLFGHPARADAKKKDAVRADHELFVFGLLNIGVAVQDGGLARAYAASGPMVVPLAAAAAGRVAAAALLLHFVLQYADAKRTRGAMLALHGGALALAIAAAAGLIQRFGEARIERAVIAGVELPALRVPTTALGPLVSATSAAAAFFALAVLARAFLRGRREAVAFVGMTLLAVTTAYDALRAIDWAMGPPLEPIGYAAFVNGVMMTLLARFTELRKKLEERARELKQRARALSRSYDELRAAQDELVRKEQLAAVGELSAVVAHEVRNPLAIISNAVATLRRPGIEADDRDTLLGILDEETTRLNRLVGDLLRYARPIALERQPVSLRELVERAMTLAAGHADVQAELVESEPVEKVFADPNLLRQVFDNLIDNAIQAMSSGGVLTVTLVSLELDGVRGVEVQIQDTGEGMDTEVRARALDPFFTTRPSGTGLGLAIVARIVDAHGGALRIKSKAGSGTVMHVFLPISGEPAPLKLSSSPSDRPSARSSEPPLPAELRKSIGRGRR